MPPGRRVDLAADTRPGQTLALALLANAPIALSFILLPLAGRPPGALALGFVIWATPALALAALARFATTPRPVRAHRAARMGALLAGVALLLAALAAVAWLGR